MRILYVSSSGALGGAERVLLDLVTGMGSRGHEVRLLSGEPGPLVDRMRAMAKADVLPFPKRFAALGESGRGAGAVLLELPLVAAPLAGYLRRVRRAARNWMPDVVHSNGTKAHVVAAWAGLPGALVWHLHEYVGARAVSSRLLRASAGRLAGAIANSASVAADFARAVPGTPIYTVHNAVDLDRFSTEGPVADLDGAASLPPAPPGAVRVGLVATYAWWKGHDVFLRALAQVPPEVPIRGYIVGGSVYQTGGGSQVSAQSLTASIARLGLAGRVGLTGFLDDVPAVMRGLDIVVHASTEPEPFGLVIAEAMACGRAVVVSAAGGAAEIVVDGVDALTCAPGDDGALARHVERLARDRALREELGRAAHLAARQRFDRDRVVREVEAIYAKVTSGTA